MPSGILQNLLRVTLGLTLGAAAATPCVQPPLTSPGVCIDTDSITALSGNRFQVNIYVKGYELFGGNPGHFCGCALTLPIGGKLCDVIDAEVVFAGTDVPVPGFADWQDTHEGSEAWGLVQTGDWYAFTAPVVLPISASIPVDLCFTLVGKLPQGPLGNGLRREQMIGQGPGIHPAIDLTAEVLAILEAELPGSLVGTDEANALGEPLDHHQGVFAIASVMPGSLAFLDLGGGVPGTQGPLSLFADGPMTTQGGGSAVLTGGLPQTQGILAFGLSAVDLPYFGGTFVPAPDLPVPVTTDGQGGFDLPFPVLPAAAQGTEVYMQFWQPDPGAAQGQAGSNALVTELAR